MKLNDKFFSLLGMARKANRLGCGHDSVIGSIKNGSSKLIILSSNSSPRLEKEIYREIQFSNISVPVVRIDYDMLYIGNAIGLKSAVVSVNDEGFASKLFELIQNSKEDNV